MANEEEKKNCGYLIRRIGSTNYRVRVYFSDTETETMEEKILRMVKNEAVQETVDCGIIKAPQMSRQSERSAECA